ncbi:MAG TPA: cytochrome c [Burkholderiales bacterium]|nr:cytochrome c [Burkholderiales bacterium]
MKPTLVAALLCLFPLMALAEGDPVAGKQKAAACATCHGEDGKAPITTYPKLAGQNAPYLVYALRAYKANQRKGALSSLMTAIAVVLSDQDMEDLAAHFASLQP